MRKHLVASLFLLASLPVFASMEDALDAFKKGNYGAAVKELNVLGEAGNISAQIMLGALYNKGGAVPQDDRKAAEWFEKAANQGNAEAQYQLGYLHENSRLPRNYKVAADWYHKAAQQGSAKAQARLGAFYSSGTGVTQNINESLLWTGKAAFQGNADAQLLIGLMYELGKGVPQNSKMAMGWLMKAAAQNQPEALLLLANMYKDGESGTKDPILAYSLSTVALANKAELADKAAKMRDELTDDLSSEQLDTSNKLAIELQKPKNFSHAFNAYINKAHQAPFRFFDRPEK